MKFQSWKRPSKQRLGVVQASQEASAKRQAQIKEAESFLRWSRGFSTSLQNWKEDAIYHFRVFLSAVIIILVFLFGSFFLKYPAIKIVCNHINFLCYKQKGFKRIPKGTCDQGTQSLEKEQLQLASKLRQLEGGRPGEVLSSWAS